MSDPSQLSDFLDTQAVRAAIAPQVADRVLFELRDECASTNAVLLDLPPDGEATLRVLACERQSAGRGRRGRQWLSWGADSLTFSVRWRFGLGVPPPMGLSLAAGLAVARACESLGAQPLSLKWPNDLLFDRRKLGGILIELSNDASNGTAAVIGVGLNLKSGHASAVDQPLAALDEALSAPVSRSALLGACIGELWQMLDRFSREGFAPFRSEWEARNIYAGLPVQILGDSGQVEYGICTGVEDDGALRLDRAGVLVRVVSGDLTLRAA